MGKYITRAAKYFIYLVILFFLIYAVMMAVGATSITPDQLGTMLLSRNGLFMMAAIVVLALLYPKSGFVRKTMHVDLNDDRSREIVFQVFSTSGFELTGETGQEYIFRAASPLKRLSSLYEDAVIVTKSGNEMIVEGSRRSVIRLLFRMESLLLNKDN